jgi:hypothetical protein
MPAGIAKRICLGLDNAPAEPPRRKIAHDGFSDQIFGQIDRIHR